MQSSAIYIGEVKAVSANSIVVEVRLTPEGSVESNEGEGCSCCGAKSVCGLKKNGVETVTLKVKDSSYYEPGQKVRLRLSSKIRLLASWYLFALPIIALVIGMWGATVLGTGEIVVAVSGVSAAAIVYLALSLMRKKLKKSSLWVLM